MSPRLDSRWGGSFPLPGRELHPLEAPGLSWRTEVAPNVCFQDVRRRTATDRAADGVKRVVRTLSLPELDLSPEDAVMGVRVARGPVWRSSAPTRIVQGPYCFCGTGIRQDV